jgi:hypothetical protein
MYYYFFLRNKKRKECISTEVEQKHVLEEFLLPSSFLRHPSLTYSVFFSFLFCMLLLCYLWVLRLSVSHAESRYKMNVKVHSHQSYLLLIFYSFPFLCFVQLRKKYQLKLKWTHFVDILISDFNKKFPNLHNM